MDLAILSNARVFLLALLAGIVGVAVQTFFPSIAGIIWVSGLCVSAVAVCISPRREFRAVAFLILALCVGGWRMQLVTETRAQEARAYTRFFDSAISVEGTVAGEVDDPTGEAKAVLRQVLLDGQAVPGGVRVKFPFATELLSGDRVRVTCKVEKPGLTEDGFDYAAFLARDAIYATCSTHVVDRIGVVQRVDRSLFWLRNALTVRLRTIVPEPHAAFLSGLLFGGSNGVPEGLSEAFQRTGTSHILAASGYNVSLFALLLLGPLVEWFGRRRGIVMAGFLVVGYVLLAGAGSAILRAGVMALLVLFARYVQRHPSAPRLLLLTGAILLGVNPLLLTDVGFQLSLAATAAILAFADRAGEMLAFLPEKFGIRESAAASAAAYLLTLPVVIWHFERLSTISPFTNLLVLPLVPFAMAASSAALVLSVFGTVIGRMAALPAWALSSLILHVIAWEGALTFASIETGRLVFYGLITIMIGILLFFVWRREKHV